MSTTAEPYPLTDIPCPSWCTLAPDAHKVYEGEQPWREHRGPAFGEWLFFGIALEYAAAPGSLVHQVEVHDDIYPTTPSDLLEIASQAIAAAQWLEAHR